MLLLTETGNPIGSEVSLGHPMALDEFGHREELCQGPEGTFSFGRRVHLDLTYAPALAYRAARSSSSILSATNIFSSD